MLANSDEFGLWNLMIGHRSLERQIAVDEGKQEVEAVTSSSRGLIVRFAGHPAIVQTQAMTNHRKCSVTA